MSGDWFVYRIMVTNNGLDTATGIVVTDLIPEPPLTAFQVINSGFTTYEWLSDYFSGSIDSLAQGASVSADVWVTVSGTGNVCNEANAQLTSRSDTLPSNNTEQSCVDVLACSGSQTCEGEIYGKDFARSDDGTTRTSEVTCVVEASCGYAGEYSGTAASLTYGSMVVPNSGTIDVPLEL